MSGVCMVLRYVADDGHGPRCMSRSASIEASCWQDVADAAARMLADCPDDRGYVSHFLESGRAFPGYRKMQSYFYGPGLVA